MARFIKGMSGRQSVENRETLFATVRFVFGSFEKSIWAAVLLKRQQDVVKPI
jgi:hypothetical protein